MFRDRNDRKAAAQFPERSGNCAAFYRAAHRYETADGSCDYARSTNVPGHILEYFYKLHTRVVLYLLYAVVVKRFFDHF